MTTTSEGPAPSDRSWLMASITLVLVSVFIAAAVGCGATGAAWGTVVGGIVGPGIALASTLLFFRALQMQRTELALQREELRNQRREMQAQRAEMEQTRAVHEGHKRLFEAQLREAARSERFNRVLDLRRSMVDWRKEAEQLRRAGGDYRVRGDALDTEAGKLQMVMEEIIRSVHRDHDEFDFLVRVAGLERVGVPERELKGG
jgi:hypothetical protein